MSVIVVDDEPSVRTVMAVALRRAGHTVYEAATGSEALACLSRHGHQIALLVTDVMMPDMNGRQLAAEAERHWPHLRVLYVSGYIDEGLLKGFQLNTVALLSKPFQINHFTAKVEELLRDSEKQSDVAVAVKSPVPVKVHEPNQCPPSS